MKKLGTNDHKVYCRFKMLSILKNIVKTILNKVRKYCFNNIFRSIRLYKKIYTFIVEMRIIFYN